MTEDIETLSFNTAIAEMMEFTNFFTKEERAAAAAMEKFVLLLSPFAPHLAEELWQLLGHEKPLAYEPWPQADEAWLTRRHRRNSGPDQRQAPQAASSSPPTPMPRPSKPPREPTSASPSCSPARRSLKSIVVPGKLVNFVVR